MVGPKCSAMAANTFRRCPSATPDILIGEIAKHRHIDLVLSKALRVLGHASFSSQSETCCASRQRPGLSGLCARIGEFTRQTRPAIGAHYDVLHRPIGDPRSSLAGVLHLRGFNKLAGPPAHPPHIHPNSRPNLLPWSTSWTVGYRAGGSRGNAVCSSLHTHGRV